MKDSNIKKLRHPKYEGRDPCKDMWQAVFFEAISCAIVGDKEAQELAVIWLFDDFHKKDREAVLDMGSLPRKGWQTALKSIIDRNSGQYKVKYTGEEAYSAVEKYLLRHQGLHHV